MAFSAQRRATILSLVEKILFSIASLISLLLAEWIAVRLVRTIARGYGRPSWTAIPRRTINTLVTTFTFAPVFRARLLVSALHGMVAWGFIYYLLVNLGDVLQGYLPNYRFMGEEWVGDIYRLGADVLSVSALVGMFALLVRRYLLRAPELTARQRTPLYPGARRGVRRDSAVVGIFILLHVGARFFGESFHLAADGTDPWQPFASALAPLWAGSMSPAALTVAQHVSWWLALGLILAFVPYFLYSKHIHLFMAPINFLLHPVRRSMGALDPLDFEDESVEQFGAERLEHLSWKALLDAYACIMCNRCQDACPAYTTGKVLSPAALEINKRYFLNQEGGRIAAGETSSQPLTAFAIPDEAIWACTACGACIEICPVGNEPMRDILEIRRHLVLMENAFPEQLQTAFRGMERTANPWNIAPEERLEWAEGLGVPTVAENPAPELLWWVGCAPATDPQAQRAARAFTRLLLAAGVDFAVLGSQERCTGDSARRAGNEYLFHELALGNVDTLNRVAPNRIVTTCPHCLHTLKNEYPDYGGHYTVIHHTELLAELLEAGRLKLQDGGSTGTLTFHDPCYLGRQGGITEAPRAVLRAAGIQIKEMPRTKARSFCCGAGGAQMWKEEEDGELRVSSARVLEAQTTGAQTLAVGCPFCNIMLHDAAVAEGEAVRVRDVAEILAESLNPLKR